MKKKLEKTALIANIVLAIIMLIILLNSNSVSETISRLQYEESQDREKFSIDYTSVILDYLVYDAGQARIALNDVMGDTDVLTTSSIPLDIKVTNMNDPTQSNEFSKEALLNKAKILMGHDFVNNDKEISSLRSWGNQLFVIQIVLIFIVIILNSLSFTFFKK